MINLTGVPAYGRVTYDPAEGFRILKETATRRIDYDFLFADRRATKVEITFKKGVPTEAKIDYLNHGHHGRQIIDFPASKLELLAN